jgi:sugar lactone lactonase YvrE
MLDTAGLFDETFYLENNSDVALAVKEGVFSSGLEHFMEFGRFEARDPSEFFNTYFYLNKYSDVLTAVQRGQFTAFDHFITNGQVEKRDPVSWFNTSLYLQKNPDVDDYVKKDSITGIKHFIDFGIKENRTFANILPILNRVLVGNSRGDNVVAYNSNTGEFLGTPIAKNSGGLVDPDTLLYGPDGNGDGVSDLYISSGNKPANSNQLGASAILRYDGLTGQFIDVFVGDNPNTAVDETGGLYRPYGIDFGPDGNLYVSSFFSDQILRYNGQTGQFIDVFASGNQQAGGLNGPNGLLFAPDGNLYVTTQGSVAKNGEADFSAGLPSQVLKYNLQTRQSTVFASPKVSPNGAGFISLLGMQIGPKDGDLYVSDFANDIRRYNLNTGALVNTFSTNYTGTSPSNNFTGDIAFSPNGKLYTVGFDYTEAGNNIGAILRFDSITGQPLPATANSGSIFVPSNNNLVRPIGLTFFEG